MSKKTSTPAAASSPVPQTATVSSPASLPEIMLVITTTSRKDEAEALAGELVSRRLAACVQIVGPITSAFHWQGKVEHSEEWQCLAKTRRDKFAELEEAIRQLHPYDVPEILAFPAALAGAAYSAWLHEELDRK